VEKAIQLKPDAERFRFFLALVQKAEGDYDGALESLRRVAAAYPRDRVVQNQLGRVQFLKRDYAGAVAALKKVLEVDSEDIQAHYNLMLALRGMGDLKGAEREERLFRRYKADEAAQELTAARRRGHPEENNERQMIHEHESAVGVGK
jgi:Flp pilus assembly protein TadD